jgi:hypothetical protein
MRTFSRAVRCTAHAGLLGGLVAAPLAGIAADNGTAFNPKISLILQGNYANYSNSTPTLVPGFLLPGRDSFVPSGLSLNETELAVESNIDDYFHGWASIALDNDANGNTNVSVENAYIDTLALPYGFAARLGRFYSEIGYLNHVHAHAWDFIDQPLIYSTMLNSQYYDDGGQVRWIAPTDFLLEVGGELLRGGQFPGGGSHRSGIPAKTAFVHVGDDLGDSWSYRVGLSYLRIDEDRRLTGDPVQTAFSGNSGLGALDFVFKWSPHGNPTVNNAVIQGEYFHRRESGALINDPDGAAIASDYHGRDSGYYLQGVYQFVPHWRIGVRYDWIESDNTVSNPAPDTDLATLADNSRHPQRESAMVDWSHSEFSRIRLQYNRDRSRPGGATDNQIFLQYIFAMGSHPAHTF